MRWFFLVIVGVLAVSSCSSASPASTSAASGVKADQVSAASSKANPPAAPAADGIRVTVDGQTFDIPGEIQVTKQTAPGVSALNIGKNPRPSALTGGNGVLLEMQTKSEKDWFQDGFLATDVAVLTFTVWKGVEFSYVSTASMPNYPIKSLTLSPKSGKLVGSYEADINGTLGKIKARVEFGVPMPK